MQDWQSQVGELIRETYKREGYEDVLIMIGGIAPNTDVHTQVWYPADTAGDFDLRFMVFALFNHLFTEYNKH